MFCAIWDRATDNAFIPGLAKTKKEPARHSPMPTYLSAISCPWAAPGEKVLVLAWHGQGLVSLPAPSKQTSFIPNVEGNQMEKVTLELSGMCRNLFMNPEPGYF